MTDKSSLYRSPQAYKEEMAQYDAFLERLPVPYESIIIPTTFGETHVLVMGQSNEPAVVLMHGLAANALAMREMAADFSKTYRVYVPDAVGYSGKSAPTRPHMEDYPKWLLEVLDAFHLQQTHMVGISFGGWLSLRLSLLVPQRITSLTLISSAGFVPTSPLTLLKTLLSVSTAILPFAGRGNARRFLKLLTSPTWQQDPVMVEVFYRLLKYFKTPREVPPRLTDDDLSKINTPTLLLMGQYDKLFKAEAVIARAREHLPNLRAAEIVPDVGHIMNTEKPELVNARILKFFSDGK